MESGMMEEQRWSDGRERGGLGSEKETSLALQWNGKVKKTQESY